MGLVVFVFFHVFWVRLVCVFGRAKLFSLFLSLVFSLSLVLSRRLFGSLASRPGPGGHALSHILACLCIRPGGSVCVFLRRV